MQSDALQAFAMLGTKPSMDTPVLCMKTPNSRPRGEPWKRAIVAPFKRAAKTSHGPIIQPRLVGQATVSPSLTSWWKKAFAALRMGVVWVQGMALGCPTSFIRSFVHSSIHSLHMFASPRFRYVQPLGSGTAAQHQGEVSHCLTCCISCNCKCKGRPAVRPLLVRVTPSSSTPPVSAQVCPC